MTWWRRDSSLWIRTPVHRYLRRTVSDNETAMRTRCFSKSKPQDTRSDEDDVNYSPRLSETNRSRLRHYKRWQRRIEADPYKALFGYSEERLNGKGAKEWQWLNSYPPLWTIREMGVGENTDIKGSNKESASNQKKHEDSKDTPELDPNGTYPKKVNFTNDDHRSLNALKGDSSSYGIDSPSDSRRVRPHMQPAVNRRQHVPELERNKTPIERTQTLNRSEQRSANDPPSKYPESSGSDAPTRRTSFIDDFLANSQSKTAAPIPHENRPRVLQTSLQQRESSDSVRKPISHRKFSVVDVSLKKPSTTESVSKREIPAPDAVSGGSPTLKASIATEASPATTPATQNSDKATCAAISKDENDPEKPRVTRDIHKLLPKDDIDFLTADSIRASMGRVKHSRTDGTQSKEKLEEKYKESLQNGELDSLLQWKVLNDQHVRRVQRELTQSAEKQAFPQGAAISAEHEKSSTDLEKPHQTLTAHPQASVLETGIDHMMSWLHAGGGFIAQQFFQDPVDVLEDQKRLEQGMSTDPFFQGVINGIEKSRRATSQVKLDLVEDMPAFKNMVERLTNNERKVLNAARIIRGALSESQALQPENSEGRVRVLKRGLLATEEDFQAAFKAIKELEITKPASLSFARRLRVAADTLQKTAKLTRVMIFGLQSRLESLEEVPPSLRSRYLVHQLLALQDIQLALLRLVLHLMQRYGIDSTVEIDTLEKVHGIVVPAQPTTEGHTSVIDTAEEARKRETKAAADAKLSDEVKSLKNAMQGLSDDGYTRTPKPATRNHLDEPGPLANSLFRPFQSQLDNLDTHNKAKTETAAEIEKNKGDKDLVNEVKSIYEDLFGPITIYHRQVPDAGQNPGSVSSKPKGNEEAKALENGVGDRSSVSKSISTSQNPPSIQLLKEDAVSPTISRSHQPSKKEANQTVPGSKTLNSILNPDSGSRQTVQASSSPAPIPSNAYPPLKHILSSHPDETKPTTATTHTPTYHIYMYDPTTNEIIITPSPTLQSTSSTPDTAPPIPLHTALGALTHPSKFLPYLPKPEDYDIITARPNLLVLRSTVNAPSPPSSSSSPSSPPSEHTIRIPAGGSPIKPSTDPSELEIDASSTTSSAENSTDWTPGINPIDGTTRLSPTGFVGTSSLELEQEFEERRRAAGEQQQQQKQQQQLQKEKAEATQTAPESLAARRARQMEAPRERMERARREYEERRKERKGGRRVGFGGVVRTAIIAGTLCYVVGVGAELSRDMKPNV